MLETLLSYLILYGIRSNVLIFNGTGALELQREKMYRSFRYLGALFVIIGFAINAIIAYMLNTLVLSRLGIEYAGFAISVFLVGVYNLLVSLLWRKISYFQNYLYQKSYTFAFDFAFILSALLMLNMSLPFADYLVSVLAVCVVIFVMNVLVGFYVHSINRGYMNINFRDVSARLFVMAIFSILLIYAGQLLM